MNGQSRPPIRAGIRGEARPPRAHAHERRDRAGRRGRASRRARGVPGDSSSTCPIAASTGSRPGFPRAVTITAGTVPPGSPAADTPWSASTSAAPATRGARPPTSTRSGSGGTATRRWNGSPPSPGAAAPWACGGMSFGGVVQWQVASQRPPHLRTPGDGGRRTPTSTSTGPTPAARSAPYMFDSYSPLMTAYNFSPPDVEIAGAAVGGTVAGAPGEQRSLGHRLHNPSAAWSLLGGAFAAARLRPRRGAGAVLVRLGGSLSHPDPAGLLQSRGPPRRSCWVHGATTGRKTPSPGPG